MSQVFCSEAVLLPTGGGPEESEANGRRRNTDKNPDHEDFASELGSVYSILQRGIQKVGGG